MADLARLLTTKEVARYLHVNRHQIAEYVKAGELSVVRLHEGAIPKFRLVDVDAFVARKTLGLKLGPTSSESGDHEEPELGPKQQAQVRGREKTVVYEPGWEKRVRRSHG